jgi:hypothetical protein
MALKRLNNVRRPVLGTRQGSAGIDWAGWAEVCRLSEVAYRNSVQRALTALVETMNTSRRRGVAKVVERSNCRGHALHYRHGFASCRGRHAVRTLFLRTILGESLS